MSSLIPDASNVKSRSRIVWKSIVALLPSIILFALGITFIQYSATRIYDPENYLSPSQKPLAQNYAILKLVLGGWLGLIVGGTFAYVVMLPQQQKGGRRLFWLKIIGLGSVLLFSGGLPKPTNRYLIPLTNITAAWTPFQIAFSPGWIMGCSLIVFVLSVRMIKRCKDRF